MCIAHPVVLLLFDKMLLSLFFSRFILRDGSLSRLVPKTRVLVEHNLSKNLPFIWYFLWWFFGGVSEFCKNLEHTCNSFELQFDSLWQGIHGSITNFVRSYQAYPDRCLNTWPQLAACLDLVFGFWVSGNELKPDQDRIFRSYPAKSVSKE